MKLRNKKTGEIIDVYKGEITLHYNQGRKTIHFKRLEDLEEWEDYKEPMYYFIADTGEIKHEPDRNDDADKFSKRIGNYFNTWEEANDAMEKLKAWKRLKDKGFRFTGWEDLNTLDPEDSLLVNRDVVDGECVIGFRMSNYADCIKDLDLLFGGEE